MTCNSNTNDLEKELESRMVIYERICKYESSEQKKMII
jgi:hypothetical protein